MPLDTQSIEQLNRLLVSTEARVKDIKNELALKQIIRDQIIRDEGLILEREQEMLDKRKEALMKRTQVALPGVEERRGGQVGFRRQRGSDSPDDEGGPMKIKRESQ